MRRRRAWLPVLLTLAALAAVLVWHLRVSARAAELNARLFAAVAADDVAAVDSLLREGANPNAKASDFEVMWKSGGRELLINPLHWPPLVKAYRMRQFEAMPVISGARDARVVRILLGYGADPDQDSRHGRVALIQASVHGNAAVVKALIAAGADVNRRTRYGSTALLEAANALHPSNTPPSRCIADHHYPDVIRALLDAGADINARDIQGRTPLTLALRAGRPRYVEMLEKAGGKK
jgi:serine/threonine-protein phosphatase 6 regulatory ankyrin repeat subunit B